MRLLYAEAQTPLPQIPWLRVLVEDVVIVVKVEN